MATVTNYENLSGEPMVMVINEDGTIWSGLKSAYEAQQAAQATLASELSNPSTPQAGA
jgi:hypothetical protein